MDPEDLVAGLAAQLAACQARADQREQNLLRALETRQLIGQAVGILMERHRWTAGEAFARLVRASQERNTKLRDLAEHLTASGEL